MKDAGVNRRVHVRWSHEHVLTLLQYMQSIRHTTFCMKGQKPDPNLNPWTRDAAAYVNTECGLDLDAYDVINRIEKLRDKWSVERASFWDCLQEVKNREKGGFY